MASPSSSRSNSCSSLFLFMFICFLLCSINPVDAATKVMVRRLCANTKNPTFCINTLLSDPRTGSADIAQLVVISINLALVSGTNTLNYINSQLARVTDQRQHFEYCKNKYTGAIENVKGALAAFNSRNFRAINDACKMADNGPRDCDLNFGTPPSIPSPLAGNNQHFEDLIDMIAGIARAL